MKIETVSDLVAWIADSIGIYGTIEDDNHSENCKCRVCFEIEIAYRIRQAVKNEKYYVSVLNSQTKRNKKSFAKV